MNILMKPLVKFTWKAFFFSFCSFAWLDTVYIGSRRHVYVHLESRAHAPLCWKWTCPGTGNGSQACRSIILKTSVKHETRRQWRCYGHSTHSLVRKYKSMNELTKFFALFMKLKVSVIEIGRGVQTNGLVGWDYSCFAFLSAGLLVSFKFVLSVCIVHSGFFRL
jgi:hypothetical protein